MSRLNIGDKMNNIWNNLIEKLNNLPVNIKFENSSEFTFDSFNDTVVHGKIFKADQYKTNRLILFYHGLGAHTQTQGYKDLAQMWVEAGYDVIGIDLRHQGGKTKGNPQLSTYGLYVSGIDHFENYYYTNLYLDAFRLVEVAKILFPNHLLIANGGSQGGALSLFVASLHKDVKICLADMPSNCDIPFLIEHSKSAFSAFELYFKEHKKNESHAIDILKEIDLLNHVENIKIPTLLASGTKDEVCPTQTTQLVMGKLQCKKDIFIYEGYGHGGYDAIHFPIKLKWIEDNI